MKQTGDHINLEKNRRPQDDVKMAYKTALLAARGELTGPEKIFSSVIHTRFIEYISDVIGATILRPRAVLIGATAAFALVLIIYITARFIGFSLSGFETIGAFILGWLAGNLLDIVRWVGRKH